MLWCTSHYKLEFAKSKVKELRESGQFTKVYLGNYLKEIDWRTSKLETYVKIYVI